MCPSMYSFTPDSIGEVLMRVKERDIWIRVILESERIDSYSEYGRIRVVSAEVKLNQNSYLMHNKFTVNDGSVVLMDGLNYTWSGDKKNDENLVVIVYERMVSALEFEFNEMWSGIFRK
ncbi:MAG: phospholipase D-like domain-containing protein [Candidatus Korarchaeota archaeon]|nr:phospholipase D-like domain-containing protein [Candidatus Korarchaeota archaeon]